MTSFRIDKNNLEAGEEREEGVSECVFMNYELQHDSPLRFGLVFVPRTWEEAGTSKARGRPAHVVLANDMLFGNAAFVADFFESTVICVRTLMTWQTLSHVTARLEARNSQKSKGKRNRKNRTNLD